MHLVPLWFFYICAFLLGSCIGSFLNVVVYRVPAGHSILYPPSQCPKCNHRLAPYDNIPVLGWLSLKGACRYCKAPIAPRYPLVEAFTGLLFVLIFAQMGFSLLTLGYWCLSGWLLALALIDWDTLTLPDSLTRSGLVVGLVFQLLYGFWATEHWGEGVLQLMEGIQGAVVGIWSFELLYVGATIALRRQALGRGDIKLAAMIGAWLGWQAVFLTLFLASLIGSVIVSIGLLFTLKKSDRSGTSQPSPQIPFGPFLAVGTLLCALWGEQWLNLYLHLWL